MCHPAWAILEGLMHPEREKISATCIESKRESIQAGWAVGPPGSAPGCKAACRGGWGEGDRKQRKRPSCWRPSPGTLRLLRPSHSSSWRSAPPAAKQSGLLPPRGHSSRPALLRYAPPISPPPPPPPPRAPQPNKGFPAPLIPVLMTQACGTL